MYIKFIVNHTAGISAGTVADYDNATGLRLIADGIAEESNKSEYLDYLAIAREVSKNTDKSNAKTRIISLRVENGNITRFEEKKNSDADADHVISDEEIEAIRCKAYEAGQADGYSAGHAEGYKLGYDACLSEMANNIITEAEPEAEPEKETERPKRGRPAKPE